MCGIAGFIDTNKDSSEQELETTATRMAAMLRHRGPDDLGTWVDANAGVALGHRRLSIVDLSPSGHQPMASPSGRYVLSYNGEIYNFPELRAELEPQMKRDGAGFRGHSDTEVALAAFEYWGVEAAVKRFNGMFAFALWDRWERTLYLARDRFGEKPLYYGWMGGVFLFGSELKALHAHPAFDVQINRDAVALHLRYNCIPAPHSIYRSIYKLPPATILSLKNGREQLSNYWSLLDAAQRAVNDPFKGSEDEAVESLHSLLLSAVKRRMIADVPLGAFLSGGIDSSTLVALMQAQSARPVRTFSVASEDQGYNEARHAHAVAQHLHTEHTELCATAEEAMAVIPHLPTIYDEPFADSSQIPTFLVSQLARRYVTVSLSGDGGDEIFGGYNRHTWAPGVWKGIVRMPAGMRRATASVIAAISPKSWNAVFSSVGRFLPKDWRQPMPGYKLHRIAEVLESDDARDMYFRLASYWFYPEQVVVGADADVVGFSAISRDWPDLPTFEQQAMYLDTINYMANDILVKLDRASMAVSLEGRLPYLDHNIVEFAWRLPMWMKIQRNEGKRILRQVLYRYVPKELVDRPKQGFGVPLDSWLRGPLRDWAESLLDPKQLYEDGFFDVKAVRRKWDEHLSNVRDWQFHIWGVLMFQAWLEQNRTTQRFDSELAPRPPVQPSIGIKRAGRTLTAQRPGTLVISLDFELHWGVRDALSLARYEKNLLGVRAAVPGMLELFRRYDIHATWATVGLLFCETREELMRSLPQARPHYVDRKLSPYEDMDEVGEDEARDPFHFAPSLVRLIASCPGQEVGTHTFSHYYCLEEGHDAQSFQDDLRSARQTAMRYGLNLGSIVFPRNQTNRDYLHICREFGIKAYRGNESSWIYNGNREREQSFLRRGLRLIDAYTNISGHNCYAVDAGSELPLNIPSSRFLRPYSLKVKMFEPLRLRRIKTGMSYAARKGLVYHLWWHPENFGTDPLYNLSFLGKILRHFSDLRTQYGMESRNMGELADNVLSAVHRPYDKQERHSIAGRQGSLHQHRL